MESLHSRAKKEKKSNPLFIADPATLAKKLSNRKPSSKEYCLYYEHAPLGYYTLNGDDILCDVNHRGASLFGLSKKLAIKKLFTRYLAPDSHPVFYDFKQRILSSSLAQFCELKFFQKNGPLFYAQLEGKVVLSNADGKRNILLAVISTRAQKLEQNRLRHHAPNTEDFIEKSITAITSELNHPHAIISNYTHGILDRLEKGSYKKEDLIASMQKITKQLQRAHEIILYLENYTCKGALKFEQTSINALIKEALSNIHTEMSGSSITIDYQDLKPDVIVKLDRLYMQQVILHLARNAVEAMLDHAVANPRLGIHVSLINKNNLQINILDNGPPVEEEVQSRLFSPHFSTKPYGMGLGLAISREILEAHLGSLSFEPNFPSGSCFKMILPIGGPEKV